MYPNCNQGYTGFMPNTTAFNFNPVPTAQMMQSQQPLTYPRFNQTQQSLPGRVVSKLDDITPNEVPMDGSPSVFPIQDESAVYIKQWNSDGTIKTSKYVKEEIPAITNVDLRTSDDLYKRLADYFDERFIELLDSLKKEGEVCG